MTTTSWWRRLDPVQPLLIGVLAALGLMTIFSARADWERQVLWVVLGACAYAAASLFDYRRLRPLAMVLLQARIAVGAGGMFGQGWLHGLQGQLGFVPERATDFVFAIFAEEFGLLGSLLLLAVFGTLLIRLLRAAAFAPDRFGELLAGGVFVMILVQVVENVGMNIGLLPIAGIPLPLISYGGSATITAMAALGFVQSVALRRRSAAYRDGSNLTLGTITRRAQA